MILRIKIEKDKIAEIKQNTQNAFILKNMMLIKRILNIDEEQEIK